MNHIKSSINARAFIFNKNEGVREIAGSNPINLNSTDSYFWQNLDYKASGTYSLLVKNYQLDTAVADALCNEETRPRFFIHNDGILLIMRGIGPHHRNTPDNMVSLRIWVDNTKIITLEHRNLTAIDILAQNAVKGKNMQNTMQCFLLLASSVTKEISDVIAKIGEHTDDLEEDVIDMDNLRDFDLREKLSELRRKIISMRRYLVPQKEIFQNLQNEKTPLITSKAKATLREISNTLTKAVEDIDYARDHIAIYHEELQSKMSINMNRIMYMISIVTVIFLPLGLITSLLGINVAGIPHANSPYAFSVVCLLLALLCIILITIMRKLRWL